jgi:hypothetical protein
MREQPNQQQLTSQKKPPDGWLLLRWWVVLAESQHALARCAPPGSAQTPRYQTLLTSPLVEPDIWLKPNQQQLTSQKKPPDGWLLLRWWVVLGSNQRPIG